MFLLQNHDHVLWYKGQIDVYYVFITEPYHVFLYKGQIARIICPLYHNT